MHVARRWPDQAKDARTAVVSMLTSQKYLAQLALSLPSWDAHLLSTSPLTALVVQADATRLREYDVLHALAARGTVLRPAPACIPLPNATGWSGHLTPRGNLLLLLVRAVRPPPHVGSLAAAARRRPREYAGCHPTQTMEYSVGTKWFGAEMLRLEVLDAFDFVLKVDTDTAFVARPRPSAARRMLSARAYLMHTGHLFKQTGSCARTLPHATQAFLSARRCPSDLVPAPVLEAPLSYGSCLLGAWLGWLQSPLILDYSEHWWTWMGGWRHRWGDQEFWTHALHVARGADRLIDASDMRPSALNESSHCARAFREWRRTQVSLRRRAGG